MRALALMVSIAAAGSVSACGDSNTATGTSCANDTACAFGQVCGEASVCVELPCTSSGDCLNGDQACVSVAQVSVCALVECGCANCEQCPVGESCQNGLCGTGTAGCTGPADCDSNEVCENQACRPCVGDECPATGDCTTTGCDPNFHCDATTKACVPDSTSTATPCETCASVDECGGAPWKCAPLISGNACLPPCGTNDDCATGWLCQAGNCTPSNFNCATCMGTGCEAGNACNPNSGACVAATAQCESCGNDWECGDGNACYQAKCVPRCDDGACPSGGSCTATSTNVEACADACSGGCNPACGGVTPHCVTGSCVQCRNIDDCTPGQTCSNGTCTGGSASCVPPTPYVLGDQCVACISNDHCNDLFCNSATHKCESDVCASCVTPYPACTQIGTDFYCVQCASNDDCGLGGTCNMSTFACEGGSVGAPDPCASDADCDDGGVSGFDLRCDTASGGWCYDATGKCDGVTAFCPGTDGVVHPCRSLLDLFGGAGGLPPEATGGATLPGNCACSDGTCQVGVQCTGSLLGGFLCVTDPDPVTCFLNALMPPTNDEGLCGSQF